MRRTVYAHFPSGPDPDAYIEQGLLGRLLLAPFPGRLLWRLRTEATIRKAMHTAFTRPVDIPDAIIEATLGMTHRALLALLSHKPATKIRDCAIARLPVSCKAGAGDVYLRAWNP